MERVYDVRKNQSSNQHYIYIEQTQDLKAGDFVIVKKIDKSDVKLKDYFINEQMSNTVVKKLKKMLKDKKGLFSNGVNSE